MLTDKIFDVVPEPNIIILSPHYDDVPLTFGGYLDSLAVNGFITRKNIRIVNIFSRSNYQARDDQGNSDQSMKRLQYATGIRLIEDLNCLDELIGKGNYSYEIKAERECVIRQKAWKPGEAFEFPHGTRDDFDEEDWQIFERIKKYALQWIEMPDTALLLPLGIKEHIDHIILREALMETILNPDLPTNVTIYFGEDQPYTGLADKRDWAKAQSFIQNHSLLPLDYPINAQRKAEIVREYYPTQVEESYMTGILNRSKQLMRENGCITGVERIYRWVRLV